MFRRRAAEQRFDRVHRRDQPRLLGGHELAEHGAGVVLRAAFQRRVSGAAARRERQMALPGVARRNFAADQAAFLEIAQHAAQIAGIEIERAADLGRGRGAAAGDLVKHPRLGERIGAVEKGLAQHADLPRVEAVEAADRGDALVALAGGRHDASLGQILDLVKYLGGYTAP